MTKAQLKNIIEGSVKTNGIQLITGETLQETLKTIVDNVPSQDEVTSGIKGIATQTNAPTAYSAETYPDGLFERYVVSAPITSPNSWGNIAVTQEDLDANFVQIWVTNGVAQKIVTELPDNSISDWEAKIYPEKSLTIKDDAIWRVADGQSAGEGDVPGDSDKWMSISNDLVVRKSLDSFVNSSEPEYNTLDSSLPNWQTYLVNIIDNHYATNSFFNTLTINGLSSFTKLKYHGRRFSADAGSNTTFKTIIGVKTNGARINLLDSIPDTDPNNIVDLIIDLQDIETIHIALIVAYRSEVEVSVNNPNYVVLEDAVKNYTDSKTKDNEKVSKSLKTLIDDSALLKIDTNSFLWFKQSFNRLTNEFKNNPYTSILTIKNISENTSLNFRGRKAQVNSQEDANKFATLTGKKADGTLEALIPAFIYISGAGPQIEEFTVDITDYVELYVTQANPFIGEVFITVDNPFVGTVEEDAVKKYTDSKIKLITEAPNLITVSKLGNIDSISRAFLLAQTPGKHIIKVMPGIYEESINGYGDIDFNRNIDLIGFDKKSTVVLQEWGDRNRPPMDIATDFYCENLTFKSTNNKPSNSPNGMPYAVHCDFGLFPSVIEFFNCDFINDVPLAQAFGAGSWQGATLRFRNCVFRKNNLTTTGGSMYWHNKVQNGITNQRLEMLFCEIYSNGGATLQLQDANQTNGGNTNPALSQASVLFVGNTFRKLPSVALQNTSNFPQ